MTDAPAPSPAPPRPRDETALPWKYFKNADPVPTQFRCVITDEPLPRTLFYSYDDWADAPMQHAVELHNAAARQGQGAAAATPDAATLAQLCSLQRAVKRLQAFKDYVHTRLDEAGVPVDPDSPHKAEGCRIGGRLDWLLAALAANARLLEAHRRFHRKVACPGGLDCDVCTAELSTAEAALASPPVKPPAAPPAQHGYHCKLCDAPFVRLNGMASTTCDCARTRPDELAAAQRRWDESRPLSPALQGSAAPAPAPQPPTSSEALDKVEFALRGAVELYEKGVVLPSENPDWWTNVVRRTLVDAFAAVAALRQQHQPPQPSLTEAERQTMRGVHNFLYAHGANNLSGELSNLVNRLEQQPPAPPAPLTQNEESILVRFLSFVIGEDRTTLGQLIDRLKVPAPPAPPSQQPSFERWWSDVHLGGGSSIRYSTRRGKAWWEIIGKMFEQLPDPHDQVVFLSQVLLGYDTPDASAAAAGAAAPAPSPAPAVGEGK